MVTAGIVHLIYFILLFTSVCPNLRPIFLYVHASPCERPEWFHYNSFDIL